MASWGNEDELEVKEIRVGIKVGNMRSDTPTLFKTNILDFPFPISNVCTSTAVPSSREKNRFFLIIQTQMVMVKKLHPISDQKANNGLVGLTCPVQLI